MFEGLKTSGLESLVPAQEDTAILNEAVFDAMIDNESDLSPRQIAATQRVTTQNEIGALTTAIETFGLQRGLLAFANYNGALSGVVTSIPAVESLTTDLTPDASQKIVADLKTLNASFDSRDEPAEEDIVVGFTVFYLLYMFMVVYVGSWIKTIQLMKVWKDDKAGRLAKVVPAKVITEGLTAVAMIPKVMEEVKAMTLPKNLEELKAFQSKLAADVAPLSKFGVMVKGADVMTMEFAPAVKANIETLGYHENSLVEIAGLAARDVDALKVFKNAKNAYADVKWKEFSKEERKYMEDAYYMVKDLSHTVSSRAKKMLKLAKMTTRAIQEFYMA